MIDEPTFPDPNWQENLRSLVLPENLRPKFTLQGLLWALEEALDAHEREIIDLRIGRHGPVLSQDYVARGLGLTLTHVRRLENEAILKMREAVQKDPFSWV